MATGLIGGLLGSFVAAVILIAFFERMGRADMTGPGCDEDEMPPGPTYTTCLKCGKCLLSDYNTICVRCELASPLNEALRRLTREHRRKVSALVRKD